MHASLDHVRNGNAAKHHRRDLAGQRAPGQSRKASFFWAAAQQTSGRIVGPNDAFTAVGFSSSWGTEATAPKTATSPAQRISTRPNADPNPVQDERLLSNVEGVYNAQCACFSRNGGLCIIAVPGGGTFANRSKQVLVMRKTQTACVTLSSNSLKK